MLFCGQCGLQLAPGSTTCPRCGSVTEPELAIKDPHTDDPTLVSKSSAAPPSLQPHIQHPMEPSTPHQQKLVLRFNGNNLQYGRPASSAVPEVRTAHPGSHPGDMAYPPFSGQFGGSEPLQRSQQRGRGRGLALLIFLLMLLLALGATVVIVVKADLLKGLPGNNATPTVSTTPAEEARMLIQQYYNDINKKNYQDAYNLWGASYQSNNSFSSFAAGYAHTQLDDISINKLTALSDGTVKAEVIITALENTTTGTMTHTYQGTYIIGQEHGAWKFLSGSFNKVQ